MAWTSTDLDAIEAAIVQIATTGTQTVRFSDGREVTYYAISELLRARDAMKAVSSSSSGSIRTTLASFRKD